MPDGDAAPKLFLETIPQEFRDRPYLKDIAAMPEGPDAISAVFKKLDGAETLIGKKTGIPGDDAKPEDWDKFFDKLRPSKAEDYEIPAGENPDTKFLETLRAAAHHGKLNKLQLKGFLEKLIPEFQAREKASKDAQAKVNQEFDTLVAATFGPDNAKVLERARLAIKENAPASLQSHIERLDNNALTILAGVVNSILVKYTPEDKLNGGSGAPPDVTNLRDEARKLQALPEWKDTFHAKHEEVKAKVKAIYEKLEPRR